METTTMAATERAAVLRKRIIELGERKRRAEAARGEQSGALAREVSRRTQIIESLSGTGAGAKAKLHKELDGIDAGLVEIERLAESFGLTVKKLDGEIATLSQELNEVERVIQAEERAKSLETFRIKYEQAVRRAIESLDNARTDLAALTILETNARTALIGKDADELNLNRICEPIFAEFALQQANLDARGWRPFPGIRNLQFLIRPMVRG
jgi:DNA repair ATPase RecN